MNYLFTYCRLYFVGVQLLTGCLDLLSIYTRLSKLKSNAGLSLVYTLHS